MRACVCARHVQLLHHSIKIVLLRLTTNSISCVVCYVSSQMFACFILPLSIPQLFLLFTFSFFYTSYCFQSIPHYWFLLFSCNISLKSFPAFPSLFWHVCIFHFKFLLITLFSLSGHLILPLVPSLHQRDPLADPLISVGRKSGAKLKADYNFFLKWEKRTRAGPLLKDYQF